MEKATKPIPQPPTAPFIGNITDLDSTYPLGSMVHLTKKYGPIYKLSIAGKDLVVVSSRKLVNETCDDSRFKKSIQGDLEVCFVVYSCPYACIHETLQLLNLRLLRNFERPCMTDYSR